MKPDKPRETCSPEIHKQLERADLPSVEVLQGILRKVHISIISSYLAQLEAGEIEITHEMAMDAVKCLLSSYHLLFEEQAKG